MLEKRQFQHFSQIKDGSKSGYGILETSWVVMEGNWQDDKLHGQGRSRLLISGGYYREYRGSFYEGEFHGQGFIIHYDPSFQTRMVGEWKHGIEWNVTEEVSWTNGRKDFRKWVNGREQ